MGKIRELQKENFGPLLPYINDSNVTDINWNGIELWIDDLTKGRYVAKEKLSPEFVNQFSILVSNVENTAFNKYKPLLEADTDNLRISILHESRTSSGRSISIRKTPPIKRIDFKNSIEENNYCSVETANLLSNAVKSKFNIVVCGLPGVGKTELIKYLTSYIFPKDRVITIEDNMELRYRDINPGKDCVCMKVDEIFTYVEAIKASLRQFPSWIMLSEARSVEVKYLLEALSTGAHCMTTIHTDDVRKVPDRIKNMIGETIGTERLENDVYSFIDMAILINKKTTNGKITRYIDQVATFSRNNEKNTCNLLINEGKRTNLNLQDDLLQKMKILGIKEPWEYTFIDQ